MARSINDFPVELVRLVLRQVKLDGNASCNNTLVRTLVVCRLWSDIVLPILYADICLGQTQQLIRFHATPRSHRRLIRSFTLHIPYTHRLTGLGPVSDWFEDMENLESFSLSGNFKLAECRSEERKKYVRHLVEKLPPSVCHLELDFGITQDFRSCNGNDTLHLCPLLKAKIQSLQTLRLRLSRLCKELFDSDTAKPCEDVSSQSGLGATGRTVVINTIGEIAGWKWDDNSAAGLLTSQANLAIKCGTIQNIRRLSILSAEVRPKENPAGHHRPEDDISFSAVNDRRLDGMPRLLKFPTRNCRHRSDLAFMRYRDPDGEERDVVGFWKELRQLAEGSTWIETKDRHRIPRLYFESHARFDGVLIRDPTELTDDQIEADSKWFLIAKEKKHGRLLHTQEFDSLDNVGPMTRDLTPSERRKAAAVIAGDDPENEEGYSSCDETENGVEWSRELDF